MEVTGGYPADENVRPTGFKSMLRNVNTMRMLCETASNDRLFLSWNKKYFKEMEGNERKWKEMEEYKRKWKQVKGNGRKSKEMEGNGKK